MQNKNTLLIIAAGIGAFLLLKGSGGSGGGSDASLAPLQKGTTLWGNNGVPEIPQYQPTVPQGSSSSSDISKKESLISEGAKITPFGNVEIVSTGKDTYMQAHNPFGEPSVTAKKAGSSIVKVGNFSYTTEATPGATGMSAGSVSRIVNGVKVYR